MGQDNRRSSDEIEAVVDTIDEHAGSKWPGMTYEQGVSAALRWANGDTDDSPMQDE